MRKRRPQPEVYSISGARTSLDDDLGLRMKRYLISMSVRTVCFVLAVVFDGPLRWVFVGFAIVLPYVAVVLANVGRSAAPAQPAAYRVPQQAIEGDQARRLTP